MPVKYQRIYVVRCAIQYHVRNLENVKNTQGGALILVLLKLTRLHGCFSRFLIVQMVPNRATHHICRSRNM